MLEQNGIFAEGIENELRAVLLETEWKRRISYVNCYTQKKNVYSFYLNYLLFYI